MSNFCKKVCALEALAVTLSDKFFEITPVSILQNGCNSATIGVQAKVCIRG